MDFVKTLILSLPIDAAKKAEKYFSKNIDWCKQPCFISLMPDQPDPAKRVLSARISRELYRKLQKSAKASHEQFNDHVRNIIVSKTDHVELTKSDYEQILREKEEYIAKQKKNRKRA